MISIPRWSYVYKPEELQLFHKRQLEVMDLYFWVQVGDQAPIDIILLNLGLHVLAIITCLFGWLLMVKAYVWFLIISVFFCPFYMFKSIMIYFDSIQYCKLLEQYG